MKEVRAGGRKGRVDGLVRGTIPRAEQREKARCGLG